MTKCHDVDSNRRITSVIYPFCHVPRREKNIFVLMKIFKRPKKQVRIKNKEKKDKEEELKLKKNRKKN